MNKNLCTKNVHLACPKSLWRDLSSCTQESLFLFADDAIIERDHPGWIIDWPFVDLRADLRVEIHIRMSPTTTTRKKPRMTPKILKRKIFLGAARKHSSRRRRLFLLLSPSPSDWHRFFEVTNKRASLSFIFFFHTPR